ncbi:hypothetical protein EDB84DRAFT_1583677 [Lactarius hengduanensis]|nr:hypothetical protein EDB84DRAFT_1583677 [Lactarius hengduanensis]
MSNATNSGERMSTRGDAKEKMSKVMAIVRSGGLEEDSRQENSKAAKKSGKASTGKASTGKASTSKASKKVPVSKLAELEDASLRKAEAARSSHPRRLTDEVLSVGVDVVEVPCSESEINDASQEKEKTAVKAVTKVNAGTTDAARPIHKVAQNELGSSSDDDDDDDESDRPPPKASGTKAAGKKKKKASKAKLVREEIKSNRMHSKQATRSENGGRDNQTFETPDAKKNINTTVVTWVHGISPPNSPPPKKQKSVSAKPSIVISKVSTKAKTTSGKSASCAIVSTSTTNVLAKPVRRAKRRHEELESSSDSESDGEVEGGVLGGMDDDYDDAMEQAAAALSPMKASAAAQRNKNSLDIRTGIAGPTQTKKPKKRGNGELPNGALDSGRWSAVFIPTFLRYLGGMEKDIWAFKRRDTVHVLQAIWNTVYAGSTDRGMPKVKHMVEIGGAVHEVAVQRATEWRNAVGSTGLSVVGDFMDSTGLDTTEARREAAEQLLSNERYVYLKTKDVVEDGMATVKRAGRYRGPLVTHTLAQCWIDFEGSVEVPGYVDDDDFPYAALVLCATSVHRALWLWANGYISKESYDAGLAQKKNGILKALGPDGKFTKTTNFSKEQWEEISDIHTRDVWSVEPEKLRVVRADIDTAVNRIRNRKPTKRRRQALCFGRAHAPSAAITATKMNNEGHAADADSRDYHGSAIPVTGRGYGSRGYGSGSNFPTRAKPVPVARVPAGSTGGNMPLTTTHSILSHSILSFNQLSGTASDHLCVA